MRTIRLSGREASILKAIGFAEPMAGAEIQDLTRMELEDLGDTLNSLLAGGFIESIPCYEQVDLAEVPVTSFEINPAYTRELKDAIRNR